MRDIRKTIRPMDSRSTRGVLSRGKPIYRFGSNSPKSLDLSNAARKKLKRIRG